MTKEFGRYRVDVLGLGGECIMFHMVTARTPMDAIKKTQWWLDARGINREGYEYEAMERYRGTR